MPCFLSGIATNHTCGRRFRIWTRDGPHVTLDAMEPSADGTNGPEAVAVVGAGVKTPVGCTPDALWQSLLAGRTSAQPFDDDRLPPDAGVLAARVDGFDPTAYLTATEIRRLDRCHHLAIGAAQDALDDVRGALPPPDRRAIVCGTGFGATETYERQHTQLIERGLRALSPLTIPVVMPSSVTGHLALRFEIRGPSLTVSTACASGATAIGEGAELLRTGRADLVVAGGVDAMVTYNALCSFLRLDVMSRNVAEPGLASRPFDVDRDGFVMSEGAGFVVLERAGDASNNGRDVLGVVLGYGSNSDAYHLVAPSPHGAGARACMETALARAGCRPADVNHVNAHGTATVLNDQAEAEAITSLFGRRSLPVTAVKGATGHMIGGSGAAEAIVTLWSLRYGLVPPVAGLRKVDPAISADVVVGDPRPIGAGLGLSNAFGFGGTNACLVLGVTPPAS
jgi:3-oxoacyl-[acyl-carrier-protein] synthase II